MTSTIEFRHGERAVEAAESFAAFASCSAVSTMPGTMAGMRCGSGFSHARGDGASRAAIAEANPDRHPLSCRDAYYLLAIGRCELSAPRARAVSISS